ncbi:MULTISPECIES: nuclear transport factor 2 family protein [unclassified Sphingobium]|uniref:nuclear transport factor 2 family protein n=1 Tax=unclassified Sphingobium TaxID=2611147 RepID=UPI000D15EEE6|nr:MULTISPECIES: nuclear transport factor 2 family protein [unclassified Sphingobium]MBG6119934.1 hypothetical protein [Sphingobium sp. JAI105]PSO11899.1 hypothetical protein C7E20_10655 [Sphingobium sp. AEW4]TWC96527.1 SnoaL-like protein [Sphingobium sp. AEW010]TWD16404.1 SnoaL-like protein [Sphingobium sp. AEW013]TWD19283.1 SnoaL-like protein [Sphingobium sp. AEW001]
MPRFEEDLAAITAAIVQYSRAMDERRWDLMEAVFVEEAEIILNGKRFAGRARGIAAIRACIECCRLTHHANTNIHAVIDGDTASVRHNIRAWHAGGKNGDVIFEALGIYEDEFVRRDGRWLMRRRSETTPGSVGDPAIFAAAAPVMRALIAESEVAGA